MPTPHLMIVNGSVHTMDEAKPLAEAIAIDGERIIAIGSNQEIRRLAGKDTRIFDAGQGTVLPGFNDAHVHFLAGGFSLSNVSLRDTKSVEEMTQRLADYVGHAAKGSWVLGGDWDHENWRGGSDSSGDVRPLPSRSMIDSVTPNNPVLVNRLDGHMALANSLALKLAGVTRHTEDPPGGVIVRHEKAGEPTGILKDAAQALVERVIPPKSLQEKRTAAQAATNHAARLGVTSLTDVSADDDINLYGEIHAQGTLKTRIYAARSIVSWKLALESVRESAPANDWVRGGVLKGFSDGSLGSSTALFFEPYDDAPANRGLLFDQMFPEGIMQERMAAADRSGLQVMIHAIGDEANFRILNLYGEVATANGARDRRFRIEHAQHLRPSEIARFGQQQVIASMQPYHAADDGRWCERRIGSARSKTAYAFRSLLDSGSRLAFGSDWTVAPLDPLLGIKAAVTRQTLDGQHPNGWVPEQKITLDEAIRAYTVGSAYAEFSEARKGTITPGKLADVIVLERDLYKSDPSEIDRHRVVMTIVGGEEVFAR